MLTLKLSAQKFSFLSHIRKNWVIGLVALFVAIAFSGCGGGGSSTSSTASNTPSGPFVSGVVNDDPVAGASVYIDFGDGTTSTNTTTKSDGSFTIPLSDDDLAKIIPEVKEGEDGPIDDLIIVAQKNGKILRNAIPRDVNLSNVYITNDTEAYAEFLESIGKYSSLSLESFNDELTKGKIKPTSSKYKFIQDLRSDVKAWFYGNGEKPTPEAIFDKAMQDTNKSELAQLSQSGLLSTQAVMSGGDIVVPDNVEISSDDITLTKKENGRYQVGTGSEGDTTAYIKVKNGSTYSLEPLQIKPKVETVIAQRNVMPKVEATLGSVSDGVVATIPPFALNTEKEIKITKVQTEGSTVDGRLVLKMEPTGLKFDVPITVTVNYGDLGISDPKAVEWRYGTPTEGYETADIIGINEADKTISLSIDHFSNLVVRKFSDLKEKFLDMGPNFVVVIPRRNKIAGLQGGYWTHKEFRNHNSSTFITNRLFTGMSTNNRVTTDTPNGQCVQFATRFIGAFFHNKIVKGIYGKTAINNYENGVRAHYRTKWDSIQPGDYVFIKGKGSWGHTAVVYKRNRSYLELLESNSNFPALHRGEYGNKWGCKSYQKGCRAFGDSSAYSLRIGVAENIHYTTYKALRSNFNKNLDRKGGFVVMDGNYTGGVINESTAKESAKYIKQIYTTVLDNQSTPVTEIKNNKAKLTEATKGPKVTEKPWLYYYLTKYYKPYEVYHLNSNDSFGDNWLSKDLTMKRIDNYLKNAVIYNKKDKKYEPMWINAPKIDLTVRVSKYILNSLEHKMLESKQDGITKVKDSTYIYAPDLLPVAPLRVKFDKNGNGKIQNYEDGRYEIYAEYNESAKFKTNDGINLSYSDTNITLPSAFGSSEELIRLRSQREQDENKTSLTMVGNNLNRAIEVSNVTSPIKMLFSPIVIDDYEVNWSKNNSNHDIPIGFWNSYGNQVDNNNGKGYDYNKSDSLEGGKVYKSENAVNGYFMALGQGKKAEWHFTLAGPHAILVNAPTGNVKDINASYTLYLNNKQTAYKLHVAKEDVNSTYGRDLNGSAFSNWFYLETEDNNVSFNLTGNDYLEVNATNKTISVDAIRLEGRKDRLEALTKIKGKAYTSDPSDESKLKCLLKICRTSDNECVKTIIPFGQGFNLKIPATINHQVKLKFSYRAIENSNNNLNSRSLRETSRTDSLATKYKPLIQDVTINPGEREITLPAVTLQPYGVKDSIKLHLIDATTNNTPIKDANVTVRYGLDNENNQSAAYSGHTDENGDFIINNIPYGQYTALLTKDGYISTHLNMKIDANSNDTYDLSMSPILPQNELRIVLTWGQTPSDLDSHLVKIKDGEKKYHVYYSNKRPTSEANLDRDDTSSYGPETVTITNLDGNATYKYYVHDYSTYSGNTGTALENSGATVKVYWGDRIYTYNVPSQPGTAWKVFEIDNGVLTPCTGNTCIFGVNGETDSQFGTRSLSHIEEDEKLFENLPLK